jgi:ADP-heptose:LPS heptosyltransferase
MNVLVINLTRFGDLLQTQPVLSSFAARQAATSLVCLKNFSGAAPLLRDVDFVFPLPGATFLSAVERDWKEALGHFENYCLEIEKKFKPDIVVNLTPSIPARLLAMRLGRGREVRGFALDEFGFNADTSAWAAFLQVASVNRGASPFNVVDLFRKVAGIDEAVPFRLSDVEESEKNKALEMLKNESGLDAAGFIGFQPGASEERRRWPAEYFSKLGRMVWERLHLVPVLFGTESESQIGQQILEGQDFPGVNLMGRTNLSGLGAALSCMKLLVTNDTGTMHLAAGLGVPLVAIFLATAQPFDTGPAREGSLSLEPDIMCHPCSFGVPCEQEHACRYKIEADSVFGYIESYLNCGKWKNNPLDDSARGAARAWLAVRDEKGFLDLASLSGHGISDRAVWIRIQREAYRRFLDMEDFDRPFIMDRKPSVLFCNEIGNTLDEISALLFLMIKQAVLLAKAPTESLKTGFLANIQKIQDKMSEKTELSVLGSLWIFQSQQQLGLEGLVNLLKKYSALVSFFKRCL